jgi:hypothetical protein
MKSTHIRYIGAGLAAILLAVVLIVLLSGGGQSADLTSANPEVRATAVAQLASDGSGASSENITKAIGDPDARVAAAATLAAARRNEPGAAEKLKVLAADPRPEVRAAAVAGMASARTKETPDDLLAILRDKSQPALVRAAAAQSLGQINIFRAVPALVDALEDDDVSVRWAANNAIRATLKVDFRFNPAAEPDERAKVVAIIRHEYPTFEKAHASYLKRIGRTPE